MVFIKIIRIVLGVLLILRYYKMQYQSYHKLIYQKKNDYYHQLPRKPIDPTTLCKTYWSILKTFNNNNEKHH